jgi:hypothetical protein
MIMVDSSGTAESQKAILKAFSQAVGSVATVCGKIV